MTDKRAFSLVELSIVLVILGLLTGGILTGQSLIRAAELRTIPADLARYQAAIYAFRDKYFALPGDMTNASDFWPSECAAAESGNSVCYGTGDGIIKYEVVGANVHNEDLALWNQLRWAGLLEGDSISLAGNPDRLGLVPEIMKQAGTGITIRAVGWQNSGTWYPNFNYSNHSLHLAAGSWLFNGFLPPEEAWNIDVKIDDGKAQSGKLQAEHSITGTVADRHCRDTSADSGYDFSYTSGEHGCNLRLNLGF